MDGENILLCEKFASTEGEQFTEGLNTHDVELMNAKRIVFIVDEAHRSTFGDMLATIKETFPQALFFGFTGTPIQEENQKKLSTTATVFGNELHRYSIADGIRDKNVLGFDPYKVLTYKDKDLRLAVGLEQAKAKTEIEAYADPKKKSVLQSFLHEVKMAGIMDNTGRYIKGIEDYFTDVQYERAEHQQVVVEDILDNWLTLSQNSKFHAIFATSSISEAIAYYRLFKQQKPTLKTTALFDPNIDNNGGIKFKEDGLVEILEDYNARYDRDFTMATHGAFKKDIAARLAHKTPHLGIEKKPEQQIDLLIVVDQMLTGFDSKWLNTLYLDKVLHYENIIQAFSRTNRLFGPDKPFGTIRYYRRPHTMQQNIDKAVKLYAGETPLGLFVDQLGENLTKLNRIFQEITDLFNKAGVPDFAKLPSDLSECGKFAKLFRQFNNHLEAAKIQGFLWKVPCYTFSGAPEDPACIIEMHCDENTYLALALRYKELYTSSGGTGTLEIPYEIDAHLTQIDTGKIDVDFMNSRFVKYLKMLEQPGIDLDELESSLDDIHKAFAYLTQEEQKYAGIFLRDVQRGTVDLSKGMTLREYISLYQVNAKNIQIQKLAETFGLHEATLREILKSVVTESNLNEYGRFEYLKSTVDQAMAKIYFEKQEGNAIPPFKVAIKTSDLLQRFILQGGFELS